MLKNEHRNSRRGRTLRCRPPLGIILPRHKYKGINSGLVMVSLAARQRPSRIKFNYSKRGPITEGGVFVAIFTVNNLTNFHTSCAELDAHFFDAWPMLRRHLVDGNFCSWTFAIIAARNHFKWGHFWRFFEVNYK